MYKFVKRQIILFLAIPGVMCGFRRHGHDTTIHFKKIEQIMNETYKSIIQIDVDEPSAPRMLSTLANELFYNSQMSFYYMNIARKSIKNNEQLKSMFTEVFKTGIKQAYDLQRSVNDEPKKTKKIVADVYQGYIELTPQVLEVYLFSQKSDVGNHEIHNVIQDLLDISLFTIHQVHAVVTNANTTNEELYVEIASSLDKIGNTIEGFTNETPQFLDEIVATKHLVSSLTDRIVEKLDHLSFSYEKNSAPAEVIRSVAVSLGMQVGELRTIKEFATVEDIKAKLNEFSVKVAVEFERLSKVSLPKHGYEMLRIILMDAIATGDAVNAKFHLLLDNK